jgi:uncharacterized iron-regulated membrane protein
VKLPAHAYKAWWDVHAWAGIVVSLVANVIFFTGVFALFRNELTVWQDPRFHHADGRCLVGAIEPAVEGALDRSAVAPSSMLVSQLDVPCAPIAIDIEADGSETRWLVERRTLRVLEERSVLSTFLFDLHYLYEPYVFGIAGMYFAGVVGAVLLLVLLTGTLIHLKDLARQLHQLRARASVRVVWSDAHKIVGLMGVPFQTMMIATGAIVCLASPIHDVWVALVFDGDAERAERAMYGAAVLPVPTGRSAERLSTDALIDAARAEVPGMQERVMWLQHAGDEASHATIRGRVSDVVFGNGEVVVAARDGRVLASSQPAARSEIIAVTDWIYGLHFGWFGGLGLRVLYALLALAGCAAILSGNWIWLARRDPLRRRRSSRALAVATLGGGLGIGPASAAMMLANRLLPIEASWHATGEVVAFVGVWIVSIAAAWGIASETRAARVLLGSAAVMFALTPIASAMRTPLTLVHAIRTGATDIVCVEALALALAVFMLACAALARRSSPARGAVDA